MRRPSGFDRDHEPRPQPTPEVDGSDPAEEWDEADDWGAADDSAAAGQDRGERSPARPEKPARRFPSFRLPLRRSAKRGQASEVPVPSFGEGGPFVNDEAEVPRDEAQTPRDEAQTLDLSTVRDKSAGAGAEAGPDAPSRADEDLEAFGVQVPGAAGGLAERAPEPQHSGLRVAEQQLKDAIRGRKRRERREQRRFTWHVRQRRRPWLVAGAAVLAVALFVVVGVFTPLMSVREVRVEGATRVDPAAVEAALAPLAGTPLALVDQAEVHKALVPFPLIQRYAIETIPPHTLVVRLEERVPVLAIPSDAGFDLVDPAGVTVEQWEARPEGVPLAEGVAATRSSTAFSEVARVLRDMPPELRAQFATATASTGQDVSFVLASGVQVVWGESAETPRKAVVLTAILNALGEKPVSLIDVSSSEAPIFR